MGSARPRPARAIAGRGDALRDGAAGALDAWECGGSRVVSEGHFSLTTRACVERRFHDELRAWRLLVLLRGVSLPHPFDGVREELRPRVADAVPGAAAEQV